jgi:hypothetical protein
MVDFTGHSRDSIDVAELVVFTHQAYSKLPVPYKYGETQEEIAAFLKSSSLSERKLWWPLTDDTA